MHILMARCRTLGLPAASQNTQEWYKCTTCWGEMPLLLLNADGSCFHHCLEHHSHGSILGERSRRCDASGLIPSRWLLSNRRPLERLAPLPNLSTTSKQALEVLKLLFTNQTFQPLLRQKIMITVLEPRHNRLTNQKALVFLLPLHIK